MAAGPPFKETGGGRNERELYTKTPAGEVQLVYSELLFCSAALVASPLILLQTHHLEGSGSPEDVQWFEEQKRQPEARNVNKTLKGVTGGKI